MSNAVVLLSLFLCLVIGACPVPAAEEAPSETSQSAPSQSTDQPQGKAREATTQATLEEMVVTASAIPATLKELPVPVQVITRKEIEEARANDLSELLEEYLPEHFQKYPGALTSIAVRGFRTDTTGTDIKGHVLILIDGHRAGTGNVASLPLENVERVEIVRGPGSVLYGSAAMGGVVNLITRRGKGTPSVSGGAEGGSWNYVKGYGGVSGGLFNEKVGFSFTGRTIHQGDYTSGGGLKIANSAYNDDAYSLSLQAVPHPDHVFSAVGNLYHGYDIGTPDATYNPPDLVDNKGIYRGYGSIGYDGALPDYDLNWHVSYYHVLDKPTWNYPLAEWGYSNYTSKTETQGVRSSFTLPTFSFGKLLLGFQWDGIGVTNSTEPTGYTYSPSSHYDNYAVLAEERITLDKMTLLLGARYDIYNEQLEPTPGLKLLTQPEGFSHPSWRAGFTYAILDWLTARAALGTAFRAPTADELSGSVERSYMKSIGNPGLSPETSTTYDIGVNVEYGGFNAGLGWFYTNFSNAISSGFPACVNGDCTWTTYRNVEGAIYSAVEANMSYRKPFTCFDMPMSVKPYMNLVAYTQREITDPAYEKVLNTNTIPYVPLWDLTGGIQLDFNKMVTLQFTGFYAGSEKVQNFNYLSPTYYKAMDKGGDVVLGARLTVRPIKYFDLYLAVDNLTNKDYSFVDGYPMPGTTVRGGLQARF
jgi:vitamin B12 transporter